VGTGRRWNVADRGNRYWEREMWVRSDGGMLLIGETSNGRESCPSVILSSTNVMWTDLGSKPA